MENQKSFATLENNYLKGLNNFFNSNILDEPYVETVQYSNCINQSTPNSGLICDPSTHEENFERDGCNTSKILVPKSFDRI